MIKLNVFHKCLDDIKLNFLKNRWRKLINISFYNIKLTSIFTTSGILSFTDINKSDGFLAAFSFFALVSLMGSSFLHAWIVLWDQ